VFVCAYLLVASFISARLFLFLWLKEKHVLLAVSSYHKRVRGQEAPMKKSLHIKKSERYVSAGELREEVEGVVCVL
jgi:hypothetical protein